MFDEKESTGPVQSAAQFGRSRAIGSVSGGIADIGEPMPANGRPLLARVSTLENLTTQHREMGEKAYSSVDERLRRIESVLGL